MITILFVALHRDAQGTFAENQKIQAVRKAYQVTMATPKTDFILSSSPSPLASAVGIQQAVVIPMMNIEQVWRDYNTFEQVQDTLPVCVCVLHACV